MKKLKVILLLKHLVLITIVFIIVIPVLWIFMNSFRKPSEIGKYVGLGLYTFIPKQFTLQNFSSLLKGDYFITSFMNSVFVSVVTTAVALIINSMAAYAFSRMKFFGKKILFPLIMLSIAVPVEILTISRYFIIKDMGLLNTYTGMILPYIGGGLAIFYLRQSFMDLPVELYEAAVIDGAGEYKIFFKIYLPLVKPAFWTLGLLLFMWMWDGLQWPSIIINDMKKQVLSVYLQMISSKDFGTEYGILFAGVSLASIPSLLIYIFLQKHYIKGIAQTGIKG